MNAESLRAGLKAKRENATYLSELFESLIGFTPSHAQCMVWLNRFPVEICSAAIERTAEWLLEYQQTMNENSTVTDKETGETVELVDKTETDILKYASGTMYYMHAKMTGVPYVKRADRVKA